MIDSLTVLVSHLCVKPLWKQFPRQHLRQKKKDAPTQSGERFSREEHSSDEATHSRMLSAICTHKTSFCWLLLSWCRFWLCFWCSALTFTLWNIIAAEFTWFMFVYSWKGETAMWGRNAYWVKVSPLVTSFISQVTTLFGLLGQQSRMVEYWAIKTIALCKLRFIEHLIGMIEWAKNVYCRTMHDEEWREMFV
jgi:hypothetical protein